MTPAFRTLPIVLFVSVLLAASATRRPAVAVEFIGHRGASHLAPENTLASIRLAWTLGADAAEIDVYLSSDGRIAVIHDETTERTCGVDWKVAERTLAELRRLDAGRWKGAAFAGERIPTLAEVLATIPQGKRLFIEIKCGPEIVPELARVLAASGKRASQTAIISFNFDAVRAAKRALPAVKTYWLFGPTPKVDEKTGQTSNPPEELVARCRQAGLDGLDVHYESRLDEALVRRMHRQGLGLYIWTVDDPAVARRLAALGVDGITTDRPRWLREQLVQPATKASSSE